MPVEGLALRRLIGTVLAAGAATGALSGCIGYDPNPSVVIDNRTDREVFYQPVGADELRSSVSPEGRGSFIVGAECTGVDYVARWDDGTVVGLLPAPACPGDVWVIDGSPKRADG